MPAVELVVTDLDGTFWYHDHDIAPAVVEAVATLDARGVPLLVATGRRLASTQGPLAAVGLAPPAIVLNGALGVDLATGDRFHLAPFATDGALAVYDAFTGVGLSPVVYVDHPRYDVFLSHDPDTNPGHVQALGDTAGRRWASGDSAETDDLRAAVAEHPVLGFSLIGVPFGPAEAAQASIGDTAEVHLDRSIDFDGLASLTVAPLGQSKWDGVLAYCEQQGIDPTRVMAVADGPNDIELLTNAMPPRRPEGGPPVALDLATHRIPSAHDAGWSDILTLL